MSTLSSNHPTTVYPSQGEGTEGQPNSSNHEYRKSYPPAEAEYDEIAQNPYIFNEKLKGFHESFGTRLKVPTIGGRALDLHRLFVEVTFRGGIEKVIRDRKWKEVIAAMNFPSTITSASFVVRKYYLSLLYHFEQVYFFRKDIPSVPLDDPASRNHENGSAASHLFEQGTTMNQLAVNFIVETGSSVTGTIDAKFDSGYLISVNLGSEKLKGVLYHTPLQPQASQNSNTSAEPPQRNPKSYQLTFKDPSRPKSNRSGYNFFFAENYNRLKPLYHGQEKEITKKIGDLWNRLTDAEKQVYQDQGLRDKERYRSEMLEYRSSNNSNAQ